MKNKIDKKFVEDLCKANVELFHSQKVQWEFFCVGAIMMSIIATFVSTIVFIFNMGIEDVMSWMGIVVVTASLAVGLILGRYGIEGYERAKSNFNKFLDKYSIKHFHDKVKYQLMINNNYYKDKIKSAKSDKKIFTFLGLVNVATLSLWMLGYLFPDSWLKPSMDIDFYYYICLSIIILFVVIMFKWRNVAKEEIKEYENERKEMIRKYNLKEVEQ